MSVDPNVDPSVISAIIELQKQRVFCIKSQSRCDRSTESFIARFLGFRIDLDEKQRKELFAQAGLMRRKVEKDSGAMVEATETEDHRRTASKTTDSEAVLGVQNHFSHTSKTEDDESDVPYHFADLADGQSTYDKVLTVCTPVILNSARARQSWDIMRDNIEKQLRKLTRVTPAWTWMKSVPGFGDLGLAIIIGEAGDPHDYASVERLWKRLGLAVIEGERQRRCTDPELALKHGFNPRRRAEIWTVADGMFKHQWAGDKDAQGKNPTKTKQPVAVPAHAVGIYGEIYGRRKAHTLGREGWSDARRDNDARRIMTKALIEDLWRVWRGKSPLEHKQITS